MKNPLTFKQLDSVCLEMAKLGENALNPAVRQTIINDRIYKVYGLLDGLNDPFWHATLSLTVAADQEFLKDYTTNGGIITAIDASALTITRNTGLFAHGELLSITIALKATGAFVAQWLARVSVAGATANIVTISGTPVTFAGATHTCYVNGIKTLSVSTADISASYIKQVLMIYDDQGSSGNRRVFDLLTDPRAWSEAYLNPYNTKRIKCFWQGDTILFQVGVTATALGTVQALVKGKPSLYTDAAETNNINTPPEENAMLEDEIAAEYAHQAGKDVPTDIQTRLVGWQKMYDAAAANRAKAMESQTGEKSA